uniref:Uncharacterized protein n=1 Tax=Rhizophora mucronata TaxID=61149 RepID=A0A2P2JA70_RHIMU
MAQENLAFLCLFYFEPWTYSNSIKNLPLYGFFQNHEIYIIWYTPFIVLELLRVWAII